MIIENYFSTSRSFKYKVSYQTAKKFFLNISNDYIDLTNSYDFYNSTDLEQNNSFIDLLSKNNCATNEAGFYIFLNKNKILNALTLERNKEVQQAIEEIDEIYNHDLSCSEKNDAQLNAILEAFKNNVAGKGDSEEENRKIKYLIGKYKSANQQLNKKKARIYKLIDKVNSIFSKCISEKTVLCFVVSIGKNGVATITALGHKKYDKSPEIDLNEDEIDFKKFDITLLNDAYEFGIEMNKNLNAHLDYSNYFLKAFNSCLKEMQFSKIKETFEFFSNGCLDRKNSKQTIYSKLFINKRLRKMFFKASCDSELRQENKNYMKIFESIKQYFNLCSYQLAFYKNSSFSSLNEFAETAGKYSKMQFSYNSKINEKLLDNKTIFENCNIFTTTNRTVVFVTQNILFNLPTELTDGEREIKIRGKNGQLVDSKAWINYNRLSENHLFRYMAEYYYRTFIGVQNVLLMKKTAHSILRDELQKDVLNTKQSLKRMKKIHYIVEKYNAIDGNFNCSRIYTKEKDIEIYSILEKEYNVDSEQKENKELLESLWEEANISNGWIIPVAALSLQSLQIVASTFIANYKFEFSHCGIEFEITLHIINAVVFVLCIVALFLILKRSNKIK